MNNLGTKIRQIRLRKKMTIAQFIKKLRDKISPTYVTKIEVYGEIPSPDIICKIADVLDCNRTWLLNLAKEEKIQRFKEKMEKLYE